MTITPRPYQLAQLDAAAEAWEAGITRPLIQAATGTGKTIVMGGTPTHDRLRAMALARPPRGAWIWVIVPRIELAEQTQAKIVRQNRGLLVAIEQGDLRAPRDCDVIVATIQTLADTGFRRTERLLKYHDPRIVWVDEAHFAVSPSYRTVLGLLGFLPLRPQLPGVEPEAETWETEEEMAAALAAWDATCSRDRLLIGTTATPVRSDAVGLGGTFQRLVYTYPIKQATDDGILVPIRPYSIETGVDLAGVPKSSSSGEFAEAKLEAAVNTRARNQLAVAAWQELAEHRPTLAFTVRVKHAHDLAQEFQAAGVRAMAVSGDTPLDDRRTILRQYNERTVQVICNCQIYTTGTDLPITSCILMAKPVASATTYEQIIGRGLRTSPDKTDCILIDLVDATRLTLQTAPSLYGLPPGLKTDGEDLAKLAADYDALRNEFPNFDADGALKAGTRLTLADLRARATVVDIWAVQPVDTRVETAATMQWTRVGDQHTLSYPWQDGNERLTIRQNMLGHYEVVSRFSAKGQPPSESRLVVSAAPSLGDAVRVAEAFVRRSRGGTAVQIADRGAAWRQRPASPGQLAYLRKLGAPIRPGLRSGEASDLIDRAKSAGVRVAGGGRR